MDDLNNTLSDVADIPAQTSADVADTQETAEVQPTSYDSPFLAASAKARQAMETDFDNETDEGLEDIPEPEDKPETPETGVEPDPIPKPDRVSNYKQLKQSLTEREAQLEQINTVTAGIGGAESLPYLADVFSAFLSPKETFTVNELDDAGNPTGQTVEKTGTELIRDFVNDQPSAPEIYSDFFLKGMENEDNRVFAFNDALTQMFGVEQADLSSDEIDVVMENVAAKLNAAKTKEERRQVLEDLKLETSSLGFDAQESAAQRELRMLREENERLKQGSQPQQKSQTEDPVQQFQQTLLQENERLTKHIEAESNLLVERYQNVGGEYLSKAGLAVSDTDAPDIKAAKELLSDLLLGKTNIAYKIRQSAVFQNASKFLEKGTLKTPSGTIVSNNLNNAFRSEINTTLATLAPLLGVAAAQKQGNKKQPDGAPRAGMTPTETPNIRGESFLERSQRLRGLA